MEWPRVYSPVKTDSVCIHGGSFGAHERRLRVDRTGKLLVCTRRLTLTPDARVAER